MTTDTILNLLGLTLSLGSMFAAGLRRKIVFAIMASALVATTGTALWLRYEHEREIAKIQGEIKAKLSHNLWTFDRIYSQVHFVPYKVVHEALFRAVENREIRDKPLDCTVSDGSVLSTRVYYAEAHR